MKKFLSLVLLIYILSVVVGSVVMASSSNSNAEIFAENIIEDVRLSGWDACTWTEAVEASSIYVTYDLYGNVNGYVVDLKQNYELAGHISIDKYSDGLSLRSFAFSGCSELTEMLAASGFKYSNSSQIYYLGGFEYAIENEGHIYSLTSGSEINLAALRAEKEVAAETLTRTTNVIVDEFVYSGEKILFNMEDINSNSQTRDVIQMLAYVATTSMLGDSYPACCAPVAATNILIYWYAYKGYPVLKNESTVATAKELYSYMGTNSSGTLYIPANDYNGLRDYCSAIYRYPTYSNRTGGSYSSIKAMIDADFPCVVACSQYPGATGGHFVACVGYLPSTSQLALYNGWSTAIQYITYSSLTVGAACYVGY